MNIKNHCLLIKKLNSILQVSVGNHIVKNETIPKDNTTNPKFYMQMDKLIQKHNYKAIQ